MFVDDNRKMILPIAIIQILLVLSVTLKAEASREKRRECLNLMADAPFERKSSASLTQRAEVIQEKLRKCQNSTVDMITNWSVQEWLIKKVAKSVELLSIVIAEDAVDFLEVLLDGGLDVNRVIEVRSSETFNMFQNVTLLSQASLVNSSEVVKLLVDRGADLEFSVDGFSFTALMLAVAQTHMNIVEFFLERGANVNAVAGDGSTSLHFAAESEALEIIKFLKGKGADTEAQLIRNGFTPLMWAAFRNRKCSVQCLLDIGADKSTKSKDNETAEDLALKQKYTEIVKILRGKVKISGCNCK